MAKKDQLEAFKEILKSEGLKFTPQRSLVFDECIRDRGHRECDQIHMALSRHNISKATVYRTIDMLVKYNIIRKMDIGDGRFRYERKLDRKHHDHMICIESGDIIEFVSDEIENIQNKIAKKHGYKIVKHVHQLFVKPVK